MSKYTVVTTGTRSFEYVVEVEAASEEEACELAGEIYDNDTDDNDNPRIRWGLWDLNEHPPRITKK